MARQVLIPVCVLTLFNTASLGGIFPGEQFPAGDRPFSVAVGDFDRDGELDLVTATPDAGGATIVRGRGGGTSDAGVSDGPARGSRFIEVSELDSDGREDWVTASPDLDEVTVLLGRGDGSFTEGVSYATGRRPRSVVVGAFDQDGRNDLATPIRSERT